MGLLPSYSTTQGLDRFPLTERKRIYQETLIKLREDDPEFAQRVDRSFQRSVWTTMGFVAGSAVLNGLQQRKMISETVYLPLLILMVLVYLVALLKGAHKSQRFLNDRVAAALPDSINRG